MQIMPMPESKPRILFVDDDVNLLKGLERSLRGRRHAWDIQFAEAGEAALDHFREGSFDVVVTDLAMPGTSGMDLVRTINDRSPETRCVILTGTADLQTAAEIINTVSVFRFYTKPCPGDVLIRGIEAALAQAPASEWEPSPAPGSIVLDRFTTGVLVTTEKGDVIYMNQSAANMVATADGLTIGLGQVLRASNTDETRRLHQALREIGQAPDRPDVVALSVERPSLRASLRLILAPLGDPSGRIIIFVTDPDHKSLPTPEMISRLFHLTPSESRLAAALIAGQRTDEIAQSMGITISSVRTYLKKVMEKTGTNRQAELVRLLLSCPPVLLGSDEPEAG